VSGSRDKTIKLWNTLGECKYTIADPEGHTEWVSCVRFSPMTANPIIVSGGWDKLVKVSQWGLLMLLAAQMVMLATVACSPVLGHATHVLPAAECLLIIQGAGQPRWSQQGCCYSMHTYPSSAGQHARGQLRTRGGMATQVDSQMSGSTDQQAGQLVQQ
jgi:hypothetical protein